MNIMYHKGRYYVYEPNNKEEQDDNIIDNHLWLVMKYLPKKRHIVGLNDIIRFGRIPFKITKIVLDIEKDQEKQWKQYEKEDQLHSPRPTEDVKPYSAKFDNRDESQIELGEAEIN